MSWLKRDELGIDADAPLANWEQAWWNACAMAAFVFLVVVAVVGAL